MSRPHLDAPESAQHKHATILFADICGSTELIASMDPEEASLALDVVLQVMSGAVRRFGGVINHRLGDGLVALFGAPIAVDDHASRACFAALAIQHDVGQLAERSRPVRVGLSSGPIILRRTGRDDGDYDVAGVTVHIAARLEQTADPGTILLSSQTLRLVSGIARTEAIGSVALKGLKEPVELHRLLGAQDRPSWALRLAKRSLSPFVGRTQELGLLVTALRQALDGQRPAVALVGDAGIGKSRLVHEFISALVPNDWHVIKVETTAQATAVPYLLLTAMLRQVVGCTSEDTLAMIAVRLPEAILALGLEFTSDFDPLLFHLDEDNGAALAASSPDLHRRDLVRGLAPILQRYCDLHPVVFVIEDYHWLDWSSAELLNALRQELKDVRLLLLLTTRPERRPGWGRAGATEADGAASEIELAPLTAKQSNTMLGKLVGEEKELAPIRALVIARAGGTPLFLEEFAQSLQESGALARGLTRLSDIVIPVSVQSILATRIDRLSPLHRRLLQIASVIGRDVPWSLLTAVADFPSDLIAESFAVLRDSRFLSETARSGASVHSFAHALTQTVAYETLLRSDRRLLHEKVLRALEALSTHVESTVDELAHHAIHAEAWPEAARYAMAAGERASRHSAPVEAKAYLQAAIVALDRQPTTMDTIRLGIDARLSLRGISASLTDVLGMQDMLQAFLAEADHLAGQTEDRLALARVYVSRGAMLSHWGDLTGAIEMSRTALGIMQVGNDRPGIVAAAFAWVQALWYSGDLSKAQDVIAANIAHAYSTEGQQRSSATFVLPAVGFFCYIARIQAEQGDYPESHTTIDEARQLALRAGSVFDQTLVDLNEGGAWLTEGETDRAVDILERTLNVVRSNGLEWHVPSVASLLGAGWVEMGRSTEARALLEQASAFSDRNRHIAKRLLCSPPLIRALGGAPFYNHQAAQALADRTLHDAKQRGFWPIVQQTSEALRHMKPRRRGGDHLESGFGLQ